MSSSVHIVIVNWNAGDRLPDTRLFPDTLETVTRFMESDAGTASASVGSRSWTPTKSR